MKKIKKLIIGNWKMNPQTPDDAHAIATSIARTAGTYKKVTTVIAPPFLFTQSLMLATAKTPVAWGVQNISTEPKGSFTGEISADMAKNVGVTYAIIGHSERRKMGETDEMINKKVQQALKSKLTPVLCIGETTRDDEGKYLSVIKEQIEKGLKGVNRLALPKVVIAYEPVWAIGATVAMNANDIHEMTIFIKKSLVDIYKMKTVTAIPTLYGGAVDPTNAESIMKEGQVDGLLIGRQSLEAEGFGEILRIAQHL